MRVASSRCKRTTSKKSPFLCPVPPFFEQIKRLDGGVGPPDTLRKSRKAGYGWCMYPPMCVKYFSAGIVYLRAPVMLMVTVRSRLLFSLLDGVWHLVCVRSDHQSKLRFSRLFPRFSKSKSCVHYRRVRAVRRMHACFVTPKPRTTSTDIVSPTARAASFVCQPPPIF